MARTCEACEPLTSHTYEVVFSRRSKSLAYQPVCLSNQATMAAIAWSP